MTTELYHACCALLSAPHPDHFASRLGDEENDAVNLIKRAVHNIEVHNPPHELNALAARVHQANAQWWIDINTGAPLKRNVGELLMLATSELAEALEGHRKTLPDDKIPHRSMFEVEIADCVIRLLDIAAGMRLDLGGAFEEKMAYNATRSDHQIEARLAANGKKY